MGNGFSGQFPTLELYIHGTLPIIFHKTYYANAKNRAFACVLGVIFHNPGYAKPGAGAPTKNWRVVYKSCAKSTNLHVRKSENRRTRRFEVSRCLGALEKIGRQRAN